MNGNGYSNHPPTIIETAFSVAINGPPLSVPPFLSLSLSRPGQRNPALAARLFSSFPLAGQGGQTYDLEIQRRRCEQVGVQEGGWRERRYMGYTEAGCFIQIEFVQLRE